MTESHCHPSAVIEKQKMPNTSSNMCLNVFSFHEHKNATPWGYYHFPYLGMLVPVRYHTYISGYPLRQSAAVSASSTIINNSIMYHYWYAVELI